MMSSKFKYLLLFFFLHHLFDAKSQQPVVNLDSVVNVIVSQKIVDEERLNQLMYLLRNDTIYLKKLADFSHRNNFITGEIEAYNALGKYFRIKAEYPKAIYYHNKAYRLAVEHNDLYNEIYSLNMLGVIYRRMDAVKSALEYHNKALNLAESAPVKTKKVIENIAISHNSVGNIYLLLHKDDMALKHFKKALEIETNFHNKLGLAINYQNIGAIYERQGDYNKALDYYKKSLQYNTQINSTLGKIICNTSIGNVYLLQGKTNEALNIIKPNIALAQQLGDAYYLADIYMNLGKVYLKNKQYRKAEDYLVKSLSIALDKKIPSVAQEVYKNYAVLKEEQGNYKEALFLYKKFNEKQNEILNEKNRQLVSDVVIKQIKLENKQKIDALGEENMVVKQKLSQTKKNFYYMLFLVLLLVILAAIFYKQRQLNNERKLMNLEQDLLRARMNPHFIFNALNSLKMFIIQQKSKEAVSYLSTFSKLVRTILQSTIDKETTLAEEIETLKKYVAIENARFSNEIDFQVEVADNVDLEQITIPPLLIQPFIENALWHGLSPKKGDKKLKVNIFTKDNQYLVIEIIDNGIGRKRAAEIKASRTFKRKSVGIKLSEERLRHFSKNINGKSQIIFEDLYDETGTPAGTKVTLIIPIKNNLKQN